MSDDELVERIRLGDGDAAEELVLRYYAAILRYCRSCCGSRDRAEDLTQETFLRLFGSLERYQSQGRLRSFLYTIADRLCIDECRRRRPCPLADEEGLVDERDGLRQAEDRAQVDALLAPLPPDQRRAVILRYGEQLTFREIGRVMGCNIRTAQSRVALALKKMRQVLDDER